MPVEKDADPALRELIEGKRRGSYGDDIYLARGLAWIDEDGRWHEGQPDADIFAERVDIEAIARTSAIRRALGEANEAAREVGRLLALLDAAQAKASETAHAARVAISAEWSRKNIAPHNRAHSEQVKAYFDKREAENWAPLE